LSKEDSPRKLAEIPQNAATSSRVDNNLSLIEKFMMPRNNFRAVLFTIAALGLSVAGLASAAYTNVMNCGTNGNTIVPTGPASGSYTSGQTITFSGTVKQNIATAGYTSYWSSGVMEFYMMEDVKVPLIDACNDEYYNQESCLIYSCSMGGSVPAMSPSVSCPMKWPGCKWAPCDSCSGRIQDWCGSAKLPYCDEVDTVRTTGRPKWFFWGPITTLTRLMSPRLIIINRL